MAPIQTLVASTEELAASLEKAQPQVATPVEEVLEEQAKPTPSPIETAGEPEAEFPSEPSLIDLDRVLPSFSSLQTWWDGVLGKIRSLLPPSWSEKLSDWALTGILTGIVVVLLLTSVLLFPQPSKEKEVVELPPAGIETPPKSETPKAPELVKTPPPKLELPPEQTLIAAIQERVAEITSRYAEGLIQSIQANFLGSRLIVQVGEAWYELSDSQQQKIANEILLRCQKLDFRKLEIIDPQGTLLARSPVVGQNMVMLQQERTQESK